MMGTEGVPDILVKKRLMEFFNISWFQLDDLPTNRVLEAVLVMDVQDEFEREMRERASRDND